MSHVHTLWAILLSQNALSSPSYSIILQCPVHRAIPLFTAVYPLSYPSIPPAMPASLIASNYPLNEQGAVYGKRAPLRRKLRGQHKHAKRNAMKTTVGNAKRGTRGLCLSPQALADWFKSLTSNSDCCYHRLSVATVLPSYSYQRPLAEKAAG